MSSWRRSAVTLRANEVNFAEPTSSRRLRAVSVLSRVSTDGRARRESLVAEVFFKVFAKTPPEYACLAVGSNRQKGLLTCAEGNPYTQNIGGALACAANPGRPIAVRSDNKLARLAKERRDKLRS